MEANKLLDVLKKKLKLSTERELAEVIGKNPNRLTYWRSNNINLNVNQIAMIVKKAIDRGKVEARKYSIKPIVEYYPIIRTKSRQEAKWEILDTSVQRGEKIRSILCKEHGVYLFYNSQCNAIYVGIAKETDLWKEMKNAFNRSRDPQVVWQVSHPFTGNNFEPAYKKHRRIIKKKVYLHDIAYYFSAYSIEKDLIENAEALLIRVFANNLTNKKMETIKLKRKP
jgi:hypothetical protein